MGIMGFTLLPVDELRLRVHVNNDWELKLSWNASRYEAQAPAYGWSYKVSTHKQYAYHTCAISHVLYI